MTSITSTSKLDNQQRELCAISVMRMMLEDYSKDAGISFTEAFFLFVTSVTYKELFDYKSGLWKEGPDYLRSIFIEEKERK